MKFLSIGAGCQSGLGVHRCWMSIGAGCQSVLDVPQCWMSLSAGCPLTISAGSFSVVYKGLFTYYVSRRRGGRGVRQMLTIADKGEKGGSAKC